MTSVNLPISVIVPLATSKIWFFENYCLPSIEQNSPSEILVIKDDGTRAKKINIGLNKASEPYVFICDTNVSLSGNILRNMHRTLKEDSEYSFVYTDYWVIRATKFMPFESHNINSLSNKDFNWEYYINKHEDLLERLDYTKEAAFRHWTKHGRDEGRTANPPSSASFFVNSKYYSRETLEKFAFLDSQILFKTTDQKFDETLCCWEDWDFWLSYTKSGKKGTYITGVYPMFLKFFLDAKEFTEQFSKNDFREKEKARMIKKHGLSND